jgi:hypothetical protein
MDKTIGVVGEENAISAETLAPAEAQTSKDLLPSIVLIDDARNFPTELETPTIGQTPLVELMITEISHQEGCISSFEAEKQSEKEKYVEEISHDHIPQQNITELGNAEEKTNNTEASFELPPPNDLIQADDRLEIVIIPKRILLNIKGSTFEPSSEVIEVKPIVVESFVNPLGAQETPNVPEISESSVPEQILLNNESNESIDEMLGEDNNSHQFINNVDELILKDENEISSDRDVVFCNGEIDDEASCACAPDCLIGDASITQEEEVNHLVINNNDNNDSSSDSVTTSALLADESSSITSSAVTQCDEVCEDFFCCLEDCMPVVFFLAASNNRYLLEMIAVLDFNTLYLSDRGVLNIIRSRVKI